MQDSPLLHHSPACNHLQYKNFFNLLLTSMIAALMAAWKATKPFDQYIEASQRAFSLITPQWALRKSKSIMGWDIFDDRKKSVVQMFQRVLQAHKI